MKRIMITIFSILLLFQSMYCKDSIDSYSPETRKRIAQDWLDAAKAYKNVNKDKYAKSSLLFTIEAYPIGETADEAIKLLKEYYKITITIDRNKYFNDYIKKAQKASDRITKLNLYKMAFTVKTDKLPEDKQNNILNYLNKIKPDSLEIDHLDEYIKNNI